MSSTTCKQHTTATFYVSTEGDDSWSGKFPAPTAERSDGPFATLARARDAIREIKASGALSAPLTVAVRGGTYYLGDTLVFTPQDSGTEECPVTYMGYPGETPVISGGKRITGPWKPYKGQIVVCTVPEVKEGALYFRQLAVDGKRQPRSRLPNEGEYLIKEALSDTSFKYQGGHLARWHNLDDIEVVVFHSWNESRFRIADLDEKARRVAFIDPHASHPIGWPGAGGPNRYYVENVLEGIQRPGEWTLDRHAGELYYWPADDVDLDQATVVAPVLQQLVRFDGDVEEGAYVQYLNLCGLTFSDTDWELPENGYPDCGDVGDIVEPSAVTWVARHCAFKDNCVKNVGTYALEVNGDSNQIVSNQIYDVGGGGIIIRSLGQERNQIAYNHIHHCGLVYPSAVGINIDEGGGTVAHNLIHDITHSGVYTRHWPTKTQAQERRNQEQGLTIEYNEIYNVMLNINDGGGLFVRDSNILIRNNVIHDVYATGARCPGWGIYLGCETRDTVVENNVVYRTLEGVHVWYDDRNITMENNVFVDARISQVNYQNPKHLSHENIRFMRNIVCCTETDEHLFRVSGERSLPVASDYNVYFSTTGHLMDAAIQGLPDVESFEQWQKRGLDTHSIVADPLFVDPASGDYSLQPNSPALKLGFKPIDVSTVGLRGRD